MAKNATPSHVGPSDKQTDAIKVPPHSLEAEQSVLGGLMLDNNSWDTVVETLTSDDFYRAEHQLIFQTLETLSKLNQPFDVLTITEALKSHGQLDKAGGEARLFELANNTPSVANIKAYCEIVRSKSVLRQLISASSHIADNAFHPEGRAITELLNDAESRVFSIAEQTQRGSGPQSIDDLLTQAVEKIDALYHSDGALTGLPTGFTDFDNMTSGLHESELIIVAGRPSMGKTVFGINVAENAALKTQKPVLIFSMEMPGDAIAMRSISSLGRIEQHNLRTGKITDDDWARVSSSVSMLSGLPIFVDDTPSLSPAELRARARRVTKSQGQLGLIVVDYLQLMRVPNYGIQNRTAEISEISRSLKALAKELKCPVLAMSQLNRSLEQRADRRPVMSDLRESGAIEQDADLIAFIYRDEVYHEDSPDKGVAEIIIAKQRNGPIGKVRLAFLGKYTRFENLAYSAYESIAPSPTPHETQL